MTQTLPDAAATATTTARRRYPAYRESRFPAVPLIPVHWKILMFRRVAELVGDRNDDGQKREMLSLSAYRGVELKQYDSEELVRPNNESADYWAVRPNNLVVNPMWVIFGAVGVSHLYGIVSPAYRVYQLNPSLVLPSYADYLLRSANYLSEYNRHIRGSTTYDRSVRKEDFHQIPMFLPPLDEQRAIAAYLDGETARIDALVAAKRRLIGLLREKRAALISQAVTRGLDAGVAMRESGVPWLGVIPAHWQVKRLKYVAELATGHTPSRSVPEYWENCTIPWVSLNDVGFLKDHDYIDQTTNLINELGLANSSARLLPAGTVILSRDATVGRCSILVRPMATAQHFVNWICGDSILPEYLLMVFRGPMQQEFERLTMGATIRTIGMPDVGSFVVPVPPIGEQQAIVAELSEGRRRIDTLIAAIERQIDNLREYRSAVIAAAVTGQCDVR